MKNGRWLFPMLALSLTALVSPLLAQSGPWEGTLVDSKCYLADNSFIGNDHGSMNECGSMCLKMGQPAGLVTSDKAFHPIIASSIALAPHVGQRIRVSGTRHGESIVATKVEVNAAGSWQEVKLGGMM
jgi:hypothetical protein